jgi:polysaccharide export outer membrane protein
VVKITHGFGIFFALAAALAAYGCAHTAPDPETAPSEPGTTITQPLSGATPDYVIGAGDVLEVSVWKDPALSRQLVVLPDGSFSFPLVGRFAAAGKTVEQITAAMEEKLIRYIPEPDLSVIVQQVNSQVIYVIGKVNRPGHIPLNRNIDVLQALAMAGGLNIFADDKSIRIFRKTEDQTMVIPFNYQAVTEENRLEENFLLQRGDVIVVK